MADRSADLTLPGEASLLLPAGTAGSARACVHQLFEGRVDAEPAAIALRAGAARLSYRELEQRANRLAHRLRELGAGPEVRVAVCLERNAELIAALLAVLKAGAAYVPVDPAYPRERQALLLADSRPSILVTQERLLSGLAALPAAVLCVDRDRPELERRSEGRLVSKASPGNLAYLIYTSGSTGRPKGVAIEHRSAVARMRCFAAMFPRREMAGVLASTSVCFDLSVFEIFATLGIGGTVILAENALALPALSAAREVTLVNTVPSAAAELVRSGGLPASVRVVNLAGEPLRRLLVERLYGLGHVEKVYNLYGPSEDTTYSTWALTRPRDLRSPAIGVALDGTRDYVLDRELRKVGSGEEGELCLGGAGLARGYFDRPEATAERFLPDPFSPVPGERLYTTGDLVRRRPSGELDYLGRLDYQVKIRGFRIELGEIEAALDRSPGVADAVVVARELDGRGEAVEKVLVAYVVAEPGTSLDLAALRAHLGSILLDAMVPSYFVALAELPRGPNGKVDRKALPEPDLTAEAETYTPPRTPLETALAGIWEEVLGLPRVGVEDDFVALGGHSLLAARLLARVQRDLGVELTQRELFESGTVAGLARAVAAAAVEPQAEETSAAATEPGRLPLSPSQRLFWFFDRLTPGAAAYNVPVPLRLEGRLAPAAVAAALVEIVRRHEALRTTYVAAEAEPYQVIHEAAPFALPVVDLTVLPEILRRGESRRLAAAEAALPFDLESGPMLRATLLRLGVAEHHLLVDVHHIACDGWSADVLAAELAALYEAAVANRPSPLQEPPWQYRDFVGWQRRRLAGPLLEIQLGFWRQALAGAPDFLELPADRPRPPVQSLRGAAVRSTLPADLAGALRAVGRERGATLFMLLMAAYQILLQRATGQSDLLVGTPVAGRNRTEVEGLVGCFVNNLPLRACLAGDPGFGALLARTRETCLAAFAHQELPFQLLVEDLRPERDPSRPPLVQVMLTVENVSPVRPSAGLSFHRLEADVATVQFDFELVVRDSEGSLTATFGYCPDLFDPATAGRFAAHFENLLAAACAHPNRAIGELPLLGAGERHQLLAEWNDTEPAAAPASVLARFAARVAATPKAPALEAEGERLTYAELDRRANRLAHRLRGLGVGPETIVGLFAERSAEMVAGLLAIWKAGGAYLPLDPGLPQARLAYLLEDSQAAVIVAGSGVEAALPSTGVPVVELVAPAEESDRAPTERPRAGDLAYLIYTSGTTGQPKAVAVEHGQLASTLAAVQETFGVGAGDRMPCVASFSFDIFLFELLGMLLAGGTSVLLPLRPTLDVEQLVSELTTATRLHAVPALMRQVVELARSQSLAAPRLRTLFTGGDAVPASLLADLRATFPRAAAWELYGPTEATIVCTRRAVPAAGPARSLLGRPFAGAEIDLYDAAGVPVPVGVPGEIWIGGAGVARGYWRREELTAEKFVRRDGRRYFRSGDLARRLADGTLEFLGRTDQQVKVRGFRIELGEVEAALSAHPAVREAVVLALADPAGGNRLVAYVASREVPDPSELRGFLERRLPKYMVPAGFVILESLPLTANGKVDQQALAKQAPAVERRQSVAPRTSVEETLARIWAEVLGIAEIGVEDDFFALGGHSLLAAQVLSRVRASLGVGLAARVLFEAPTVAGLARAVEAARREEPGRDSVPWTAGARPARLPLSYSQRSLWLVEHLQPAGGAYNLPVAIRLTGTLDVASLTAALGGIVGRHEALRTRFAEADGEPWQEVLPAMAPALPLIDLADLPSERGEEEACRLAIAESARPFDLAAGPLLRARLFRLGAAEHLFLLAVHHAVSDAWSEAVLLRDLGALYAAAELPPLPLQFADYALWQREHLRGEVLEGLIGFWRGRLAGVPPLELPTDLRRPAAWTFRGASRSHSLETPMDDVERLASRQDATPFMAVLAALQVLLGRYSGQEVFAVGTPSANRTRPELEGVVGFFVNMLPLRADLSSGPTFRELLARVRSTALDAFAHQALPFELLVEELAPERNLGRNPIFQVAFQLLYGQDLAFPGLTARRFDLADTSARFDLGLLVEQRAARLTVFCEYAADLFEAATIQRLLAHLDSLLAGASADPERAIGDLQLLAAGERQQLLVEWNDTQLAAAPASALERFAAQVAATPDAPALETDDERLTYAELDRRANRLAYRLRRLGVGPEGVVGLLAERSAEMVAGLLAIWKAGGAYLPLDPAYPQARLAYLLEDSQAAVIAVGSGLEAALPSHGARVVPLAAAELAGAAEDIDLPPAGMPRAGDLAYLIYTSGTTGQPKAVEVEHGQLAATLAAVQETFGFEAGDRMSSISSFSFDIFLFELLGMLLAGGTSVLLPLRPTLDIERLVSELDRATRLPAVPPLMRQVVDLVRRQGTAAPHLRTLFTGGDAVPASLLADLRATFPQVPIWTLYGPTEAAIICTRWAVPAGGPARSLLGGPFAGAEIDLRDSAGAPVPLGVTGEIWIGGAVVARGYRRRAELTAAKFVRRDGRRFFRSGDLARRLPDGTLEFQGRTDQQVKVRGFRIELGEVEAALSAHPAVGESVVLALADPAGGHRLVAYVAGKEASDPSELRSFLEHRLPKYMVPAGFVILDALPLTANGKVDQRALAKLEPAVERRQGVAPRTPVEAALVRIWTEVLGTASIGVEDDFFALGGHSLLAAQVLSRVRASLGVRLAARVLFEAPTVAGLARAVMAVRRAEQGPSASLTAMPRPSRLPLSYSQRSLWLVERLQPAGGAYNVQSTVRLTGALDAAALAAALDGLVHRHEALRTRFVEDDGEPRQEILPAPAPGLALIDLVALPSDRRDDEVLRLAAAESERPFDLAAGPLLRARLFRLGATEHLFLLAVHHAVSDGWSEAVLLRDLGALYAAAELPALPLQFADYALWQREHLRGEVLEELLGFWGERLTGISPLDLPTDRRRPTAWSFRGASRTFSLATLADDVERLASGLEATSFMVLLAAFQVLLGRYASQNDFAVGTPSANRTRPELEGVVGFFVNMLPLRADLSGEPTFREILTRVRSTALDAFDHQALPFELLVEELAPERDLGRNPIFQVTFQLLYGQEVSFPGLTARRIDLANGSAKFDLSLLVEQLDGRLTVSCEYASDLFEATTVQRLLGHFDILLAGACAGPESAAGDLPLLSQAEREQLLAGFNDTGSTAGPGVCLHQLFEAQVDRAPERVALVAAETRLSYRELNDRAERLASRLRALGLGPEVLAAVLLDRTAELVIALLAVLKAGGAYAPLDVKYPRQRVLLMLETSRASLLVTRAGIFQGELPPGLRTLYLDREGDVEGEAETYTPPRPARPDNLAYVIFTSGSTGVPKGVAIQHRSAAAMIRWARAAYTPEEYAGVLASTSICFDMSVFEIFSTLAEGGRIVLAEDALALPGLEAKDEVVLVDTVPSAMAELLRLGRLPPSLRTVNLGGEALKGSLVREIYAQLPGVERVVNLYGPSEDTTFSTYAVVPRQAEHPLIGRPLTGETAYVLDSRMRPMPLGVPGALYLGGEGLSRGYLHRPELTAERFVPNPYGRPGSRLYRVGDLARVLPTGELDFLGRLDDQVKVRGFRIELGEIESALANHPDVRDAAVLAQPEEGGGHRLIAYVETDREPGLGGELRDRLRDWLRQSLPEYMVPSFFAFLRELPQTPNGKIDRRALAALPLAPEGSAAAGERGPRSSTEEVLAAIWSEIFGRPVGVRENFFDLGGHSLLATRVVSRVRDVFGADLPLRRLFEAPTVEDFAAVVEEAAGLAAGAALPPVEPTARTESLPLSFAQRRLWLLDQLDPGLAVYNIALPLSLSGELDPRALRDAWTEVARRHEVLRTTFPSHDGEPRQEIAPAGPSLLPVVDLQGLARSDQEAAALVAAESRRAFDLGRGPLLRTLLLRLAPERHVLLLAMHHVVSDAWSMEVLLGELAALYDAFAAGRPSPLPELPVQYADFAVWQRRWLTGEALARQLDYWRRQLAGAPSGLDLPTDFSRPAVQTFNGASRFAELPAGLAADLRAFCRREGVTLFMLLLAAFDALLARYSGQRDVLVGSPIANRNRTETEGLIGFFVNTLVFRANLESAGSFRDLLRQSRQTALAAYAHQDLPFEMLVEELRPERDLSRSPFFQVLLGVQAAGQSPPRLRDLEISLVEEETGTAKFDLSLFVAERENTLSAGVEYNTDLFEGATARRLLGHFGRLLEAALSDPEQGWRDLPLLAGAEREQLVVELNDTGLTSGTEICLHQFFEAQVASAPDRVALVAPDGLRLSYGELNDRAERLACRLRALGLGPEILAGVLLDRTAELVVALLAVLKAGGAYAPLDANYPRQRIRLMLESSRAAVLVTRRRHADAFAGALPPGLRTVYLEPGWHDEPAAPLAPAWPVLPENLAYVIFTSGSTGVPKAVAIRHHNAVGLVRWAGAAYAPEELAGVLASTSICFDLSVFEIFATLGAGGKIVLAEDALAFPDLAAKDEVVLVNTVPSAMAELLRIGRLPPSLRTVNLAGEVLSGTLVREIYRQLPGVERVVNLYGPSEDTTYSTSAVMPRLAGHPSIGRPLAGRSAHVLDAEMRPLPLGVAGALHLGGEGVGRGYLHRPELTAERFVPNPYGTPGSRLYRVGDLARVLPTGELDFLGRLDTQVKVRGFRIELGEIESALARHPEVRSSAVVAMPEEGGGSRLIAYVNAAETAADRVSALTGELRGLLRRSLPEYMVPSAFALVGELPRTPNGKVDRRALAALPLASEVPVAAEERGPRSAAEAILTGIWSEIFGRPVGVRENFFDLGGHSLLATRVVSRVRDVFGADLPLRRLFEAPTVKDFAAIVEEAAGLAAGAALPPIEPAARTETLPLSFAQRRLWFLDQLSPGSPVYNIPLPLRLLGPLRPELLARALSELARRHESLRTTFEAEAGEPRQVIAPPRPVPLPQGDLADLPEEARQAAARRLLEAESRAPFDLAAGPLLRAVLLRLAGVPKAEHWLLLTLHHIVADGWSMEILVRELLEIYDAFADGQPSPLPELALQYADFAVWQHRWLAERTFGGELDYWRRALAGAPASLELPADRPRPAIQSYRGAVVGIDLPRDLAAGLRAYGQREGATLFMLALAALDVLLHRYCRQSDLTVGSVVANRNRSETEGLIGFFVNTLVLRTDLAGDPPFAVLLKRVREAALGAYAHQDLPFEQLVEELQPERDLSRTPFFQVVLNVQVAPGRAETRSSLKVEPLPVELGVAKFDLTVTVQDEGPGLTLWLEYSSDLFEPATAARMVGHLTQLLAAAPASPASPISELPLLAAGERAQLLFEWTDTAPVPAPALCLHQLFEAQTARTPEAVALVSPDGCRRLTYAGLDRRAEALARRLRALGVGPEVLAGVLMDRTVELVVSLLAVLKAGGAYVPIDPAYPRQRVAFLLESSQAAVLLTRRSLLAELVGSLPEAAVPVFLDGEVEEAALETSAGRPPLPGNLAYIIYTSGSTGVPKGVAIEHRSAVAFARWAREAFPPEELAGVLGATSVCFDISIMEIFVTLAWGGKILLAENALALPTLPARGEITMINAVPSAMAELVRCGRLPDSVRTVNLGGEAVQGALARRVYEQSRAGRVIDVYGPSEDTTYSAVSRIPRDVETPAVGRPLTGSRAYVLDAELRPVPIGVPGAVYLAGDGLARGYLGRPDLTADRFIPDPAGEPGARLYRVGDLARWRPDGEMDFLGRIDHQVKVRGYRIELGEIEAALARHPAVREGVVLALPEPGGVGNRLAAFVVLNEGSSPAADLRAFLQSRLPEYMVPTSYTFLSELPRTPNGKFDRRALERLPPESDGAGVSGDGAPRTPVEEVLAGIWSDVFGRPVGIQDDFFDLGGHSLLAVRVAARVRAALDVELPLQRLFAAPTVAALAVLVEQEIAGRRGVPLPPIQRAPRDGELPLSFGQQRLWFLDRLEPGSPVFNLPAPLRLTGPLDVMALGSALDVLVARHESLRTVFSEREGRAFQVVQPAAPVALPVVDLAALPALAREKEAGRLADEETRLPFDLTRGPLLRVALMRLADEDHVLTVTMHHIVGDGWSTALFRRELADLYEAAAGGKPSPVPELPVQYADFAAWQRRTLDGEAVAALLARWKERFGTDLPVLRLPTDRPRTAAQTTAGSYASTVVPPDLLGAVHQLSRVSGTTLFMTLLAAFQALLARYTGQERITVGSPVAGRGRAELEGLIGFFVNTLVLPADLAGDPTFAEILERVRQAALAAYACQDLPFERLVEALQPVRDRSRSPLFQVMFALQNVVDTAARTAAELTFSPFPVTPGTSQFDLTLAAAETTEGLLCMIEYKTDLFDSATIDRLLQHYRRLLATAVAAPATRLSALPPAAEELPRPAPATAASAPIQQTDARRDRLAERMSKLSPVQREALERRLRGASPAAAAAPPPARCLVEITPSRAGSRPPFFCVHPAGGDVLCFFPLARHLGTDQPFYGFQARGLEDEGEPFATLEEMGAHYVSELRQVQPAGPYRLGGWSFGGLAAFEMARQLAAQGEEVALLAVIDTGPGAQEGENGDGSPDPAADDDTSWLLTIAEYVRGLRGADLRVDAGQLAPLVPEERLRLFVDRLRGAGLVHSGADGLAQLRRLLRVFRTDVGAYRSYRPRPYPGPVTLFRAAGAPFDPGLGRDLGWGRLTSRPVAIHEGPGGHVTLLAEPNVAVLAERLRACLDS